MARITRIRAEKEILNITGVDVALLLNFKEAKLTWKRVVGRFAEKGLTTDGTDATDKGSRNPCHP